MWTHRPPAYDRAYDRERPLSASSCATIQLDADGMGQEDMSSFIRKTLEGILKPYHEEVRELHMMVHDLSSSVCALQEKSSSPEPHAARMNAMQEAQDKLMHFAESTRQSLDGFINESGKIEQKTAKSIQNLEETLTLIKSDIEELRKNGQDTRTKIVMYEHTEKDGRVQIKNELQRVSVNLNRIDEAQMAIIKTVDSHKGLFDSALDTAQNNKVQEQRSLQQKFIALNDEITDKLKSMNEQFAENQSQLKQYHKEFEQAREYTTKTLSVIKTELGLANKETQAEFNRINTDLGSQIRAIDAKGDDLNGSLNKLLVIQGEQLKEDMKYVRNNLVNLEEIASRHEEALAAQQTLTGVLPEHVKNLEKEAASKHEKEVAALKTDMKATLQTLTGVLPEHVKKLEKESDFSSRRSLRLEKFLGLEPMTEENSDPKRAKKKRASTLMLGEDQLQRKAWTAWREAVHEAKQEQIANAIPNMQAMLKMQQKLIESEKSKLHSTNNRVQSLEGQNTSLERELQKLRKSLDQNDGNWRGMAQGMQAAKKAMHTELKDLPRLTPSRPGTSMM